MLDQMVSSNIAIVMFQYVLFLPFFCNDIFFPICILVIKLELNRTLENFEVEPFLSLRRNIHKQVLPPKRQEKSIAR